MNRIALMGLGLMGGSLGLGLKARGFDGRIVAYARREETRQAALQAGVADEAFTDPVAAVQDADLIVYCTPILTIPDLVMASRAGLKSGAILTDVGSTKAELEKRVTPLLAGTGAVFVGSHPICGSEQQGMEAARADLYEGAMVVVTPAAPDATRQVMSFWEHLGALVTVLSAAEHDRLMARTSHLPHLVASLLAVTAGRDEKSEETGPFCGTGFRDTSRVADGSPEVWHDIVSTNAAAIEAELQAYRAEIDQLIGWLAVGAFDKVKAFLALGRERRRALMNQSPVEG